jgi:hypothetical protein
MISFNVTARAHGAPDKNGNTVTQRILRGGETLAYSGGMHRADDWRGRFNAKITKRIEDAKDKLKSRTLYPRILCG